MYFMKNSLKGKKILHNFLILFFTSLISLIVFTSCNTKKNTSQNVQNSSQEISYTTEQKKPKSNKSTKSNTEMPETSTVETTIPETSTTKETMPKASTAETAIPENINHDIDINAQALTDAEKELSLEGYGAKGALLDKNLSINDMLRYAVEDEYLARGEYLAIIDKFGSQRPYSNIVKSEETHLAYLKEIYLVYELDFPKDTSKDHLIIPTTLLEAAETGVQAEVDNIAMYENFLSHDLPENISKVFTALKNGSDSHLLAFKKQVDKLK